MITYIPFRSGMRYIPIPVTHLTYLGNAFLPSTAILPLFQEEKQIGSVTVSTGEIVKEGQIIVRGVPGKSVNTHASIPGMIVGFKTIALPDGSKGKAAIILLSGSFDIIGRKTETYSWKTTMGSEILKVLENKSVLNTFTKPTPLAQEIYSKSKYGLTTLIVRYFDHDTSCCTDSFLAEHFQEEVITGCAIIAKALDAKKIVFVFPKNNSIFSLQNTVEQVLNKDGAVYIPTSFVYPAGNKRRLLQVCKTFLRDNDNPQPLFIDITTALNAYEAVVHNSPTLTRYISISGPAIQRPCVLKVRIGTTIGDIIEECGGLKMEASRIIINGLLTGTAIYDLDTPITRTTKSIHCMDSDTCPTYTVRSCIHCGLCLQVCPQKLDPMKMVSAITNNKNTETLQKDLRSCEQCGSCAIVCPARIPLHHTIIEARQRLLENQEEHL